MRYKRGDRVRIKSLEWYNENKNKTGFISFNDINFMPEMSRYCGEILTINRVVEVFGQYLMSECGFLWTDEMIECLVDEPQEKMVSLDKVCEVLKNTIDDDVLVKCGSVIKCMSINEFIEYFCKTMEE